MLSYETEQKSLNITSSISFVFLIISCSMIFFLLLMRDSFGIYIHKYIFLIISTITIMGLPAKYSCLFVSFILPLFVGLPGNYLILIIMAKLFLSSSNLRQVHKGLFFSSMLLFVYIVYQLFIYKDISMYHINGGISFLLLAMFVKCVCQYGIHKEVIVLFAIGVLATEIVMLLTTLNYFSINDLLGSNVRLGMSRTMLSQTVSTMVVSTDPNFLGMNAIAAISSLFLLIKNDFASSGRKVYFVILSVAIASICSLGLSRTFILVLAFWAICFVASSGDIKKTILLIVLFVVLFFVFRTVFNEIYNAILIRFGENDLAGGNGRIDSIINESVYWKKNLKTLLIGVGYFKCFTHCTPINYLFGLGIIGFGLVFSWFTVVYSYIRKRVNKLKFENLLPFIVTFIVAATLPAVGAIQYTYPIVISYFAILLKKNVDCY